MLFFFSMLAMMADNVEHVISYWMIFQKFNSPALGGFAVVSHWVPFLLFSVSVGALADRADPRRLMQLGMLLFIIVSAAWGYFFLTDSLEMWQAMLLLVIHGCAGVLWNIPNQLLLYVLVRPADLPSAVRLSAMSRYLGILVGPGIGAAIMMMLGPSLGIIVNTLFYLPLLVWLFFAPARDAAVAVQRFAVRGFGEVVAAFKAIAAHRVLSSMTLLAGGTSFLIGNAYSAQMPGYAVDLGHGDADMSYSLLLAADAAGAILAGVALEAWGNFKTTARRAIIMAMCWTIVLIAFAWSRSLSLAVLLLFAAGFFELSFNTMAQALVQINAPKDMRGRVIGVFNMSGLGLRAFSGVSVGLLGAGIGIHWSLTCAAVILLVGLSIIFARNR